MTSNDKLARLAGLLYLILLPTAGPAYFSGHLAAAADPAAALAGIQAGRGLFALTTIAGVVGFVDFLILALVLYRLLSPAGKGAASLMLVFAAASVPLSLAAMARRMDVLSLLDAARTLPALGADQLQVQAMLALHGADSLMQVSIVFWGLWLFPLGWLLLRSRFAPRVLGWMLMLGGFFYVFAFGGSVLNPAYDRTLFASIVGIVSGIPDMMGELGLGLWLLIMGARDRKTTVRPEALDVSSLTVAAR